MNVKTDNNIFEPNFDKFENIENNTNIKKEDNQLNKLYNIERCEMKLSLRKKKLNEKIFQRRKIDIENYNNQKFNFDKFILLNNSFTDLISKMETECKNEEFLINLISKMSFIVEKKHNNYKSEEIVHNIYSFTSDDLINNNLLEKIYNIAKMFLFSKTLMLYLTRLLLFSCLLINDDSEYDINNNKLYDQKETFNRTGYFISSDKYIDMYSKILEIYLNDNWIISYNMILFIGHIAKNQKNNQKNLFSGGIFKYIIDSINLENEELKHLEEKIWFLSLFNEESIYECNLKLTLKVQDIYIGIFMNQTKFELFRDINEKMDENNFLYNYLQLISNTTYCISNIYIENLLKSCLLENLMDIVINKQPKLINIIVDILMNLTNAEPYLLKRLINIGVVNFLVNIISDKSLPLYLRKAAFVPINNLLTDMQVWNTVLFDQKLIKIMCNLLNHKDIESGIFLEICYGFQSLINYCDNNNLNKLLDEYFLIQLICNAMKQVINNNKNEKQIIMSYFYFCSLILALLNNNNNDLINKIIFLFQKCGGEEILDKIENSTQLLDLENDNADFKEEIKNVETYVELIKYKIKEI